MTEEVLNARDRYYYQQCLLIAAEGWGFCSNGHGDFCYFMKGDEMLQGKSLELHQFAVRFMDWRKPIARKFWQEVDMLKNNPRMEYCI